MAYFLFKLIPPRPTFAQDQSESEAALMHEHVAYWQKLIEQRIALLYGPVLDPHGTWGLAIMEVESEVDACDLAENDPTIRAGLHRFELYPMHVAMVRK